MLVFEYEFNCLHEKPGTVGGMPSMGGFLRVPSPYLREFRRKPRKTVTLGDNAVFITTPPRVSLPELSKSLNVPE